MTILFQIILASLLVSFISFSGSILFVLKEQNIKKYMIFFVALAAGSLLGAAFFHLIPEAVSLHIDNNHNLGEEEHHQNTMSQSQESQEHGSHFFLPSYFILLGILLFYIIEKFIHWHHHHEIDCHHHSLSKLSLIGDGFHNFIDGALIAAAFLVDLRLGIVTTLAIILHEIPQEIGDLAILLHSGMSKVKALFWNFVSALTALLGAILMFILGSSLEHYIPHLIAFVAGTFIYLSLADIIPEINKKEYAHSQFTITLIFLIGIGMNLVLSFIGH